MSETNSNTQAQVEAAEKLVRHLVRRLVDDPNFIYCSDKLTTTYELVLDGYEVLCGVRREVAEQEIIDRRKFIASYRPLASDAERAQDRVDELETALDELLGSYDVDAIHAIARKARG